MRISAVKDVPTHALRDGFSDSNFVKHDRHDIESEWGYFVECGKFLDAWEVIISLHCSLSPEGDRTDLAQCVDISFQVPTKKGLMMVLDDVGVYFAMIGIILIICLVGSSQTSTMEIGR